MSMVRLTRPDDSLVWISSDHIISMESVEEDATWPAAKCLLHLANGHQQAVKEAMDEVLKAIP